MPDLTFTVTAAQRAQVVAWVQDHGCRARPDSFGGLLTYQFTPNGLGDSAQVLCPCGAKLELTDVSTW